MATTIVGYVGARLAATYWVRPHFEAPLHLALSLNKVSAYGFSRTPSGNLTMTAIPPNMSNAWPLSASIVDTAGHAPTSQYLGHACPTLLTGQGDGGLQGCVAHLAARFHEVVIYQPAGRYWPFQIYETALFARWHSAP